MAYALIGTGVSKSGSGSTAGYNTSAATLLVCMLSASTISAGPSDSQSNVWTLAGSVQTQTGTFNMQTGLYYVNGAPSVNSSHTFTTTDSLFSIEVLAFSGGVTSSQLDQKSSQADQAETGNMFAGSITPTNDNQVVIFGAGGFNTGFAGTVPGFTKQLEVFGNSSVNYSGLIAYLIQTTATAENPAYTVAAGPTRTEGCHIASFFQTAGGGVVDALEWRTQAPIRSQYDRKTAYQRWV